MTDEKRNKMMLTLPLALGLISALSIVLYIYSANHAPYTYTDAIIAGPLCSLAGLVVSIATRKKRGASPVLWGVGLAVCICTLVLCTLLFSVLVLFAMAIASEV
ncbi:MAG: hypothetical protein UHI81_07660 [Olegusella sp.]|nr:hypothetical protein [Olegusella sp.]MEE1274364.1 hypothetical protein [Olegusella sp.]